MTIFKAFWLNLKLYKFWYIVYKTTNRRNDNEIMS